MRLCLLLLPCLVSSIPTPFKGRKQAVAAKGTLMCNGKPYEHAKIKIYDVDFGPDPDDLMAEGRSDAKGQYALGGTETEYTNIDPKLNIYHNCNDETVECWRKIQIEIPDEYVNEGEEATRVFDAGVLNLSAVLPGETRDCLN